jgi:endonuclease/exonuclease/phosphatase family metal-dependent hydrolase
VTLRLVSYNIRYGGAGRERQIAAVVTRAAPDVVIFEEATDPAVIKRVSSAAGLSAWGARPGHSLGFASRTAPDHVAWHWPRSSRHAFLELVPAGAGLRVFGVHLSAIHAAWTERRRVREVGALLDAIAPWRRDPHVLVGDFNTLPPGDPLDLRRLPPRLRPFVWMSGGRIRWQVVTRMLEAGYLDVAARCEPVPTPTFPTWGAHLRLDYAFVPRALADGVRGYRVLTDAPEVPHASDHLPILVDFETSSHSGEDAKPGGLNET